MIHDIKSEDARFRAITFRPNLNVILAEQVHALGSKETANSVGKTSLVELLYLAMGGNPSNQSSLKKDAVKDTVIHVRLDVGNRPVTVTRKPSENDVHLTGAQHLLGETAKDPTTLPRETWKEIIGKAWWGLEPSDDPENKNLPTAGKLLRYVVRNKKSGGFEKAEKGYGQEPDVDAGANSAYLLGLPWEAAGAWGEIKPRQKLIKELRSRQGLRFFKDAFGDADALAQEETELLASIRELEQATQGKNVEVGRSAMLEEAERMREEAVRMGNQLFEARRSQRLIAKALAEHGRDAQARADVAGLPGMLGDVVKRRLEEIEVFHERVLANRAVYLKEEKANLDAQVKALEVRHQDLARQAGTKLEAAADDDAWKQFERQIVLLASKRGRLEAVQGRLKALRRIDDERLDINEKKREFKVSMETELEKSKDLVAYLDREFRSIVHAAYGKGQLKAGLAFEATRDKLAVKPSIESDAGEGVAAAQLWAFDLLIKHMENKLGFNCRTLVHDSHAFADMDPDQVGGFLRVAKDRSEREGWQYIVTLHRSVLDLEGGDAWLLDHVNPVRLTDAPDGGLFGVRFE